MKLCTFEHDALERVGIVIDESKLVDVTVAYAACLRKRGEMKAYQLADVLTPPSMIGIIEGGASSLNAISEALQALKITPDLRGPKGERISYALGEVKLKAPVPRPPKILAAVFNRKASYEAIIKPPGEHHPYYFIKLGTCVTGPFDPIEIPDIGVVGSEIEVAAIIGKKGKNIPEEKAEEYIYGYTVINDVTAHEMRQKTEWLISRKPGREEERLTYSSRYKCFDTFCPMGPWLVTRDEIPDIYNCNMEARLNNETIQRGNLSDLHFKYPKLISYLSGAHTLEPGDVISAGTCPAAPGWELYKIDLRRIGGVLESKVEGFGALRNPIKPI